MLKKIFIICSLFFFQFSYPQLPDGFVYLNDIIPDIQIELRYLGSNNFTGKPVPGYEAEKIILTREAALALQKIQQKLEIIILPHGWLSIHSHIYTCTCIYCTCTCTCMSIYMYSVCVCS